MSAGKGLVDLHCHLMPYVDDGAYDREECLELLKMEAAQGVETICLTPHQRADMFESTDQEVRERFALVEELAGEAGLELRLCWSREYHFDRILRSRLLQDDLVPLGRSRVLLVEFGGRHSDEEIMAATGMVCRAGYIPLIAHVERYLPLHQDWAFARTLRRAGALLQINAGSVLGREGLRQRLLCRKLLQNNLVTVIASDAHDANIRVPELALCAQHLENKYSRSLADRLLRRNPAAILEGRIKEIDTHAANRDQ